MKKVLIYSNMYPSKEKTYAGIFIKNQYEYLKKNNPDFEFEVLALNRSFTGTLGSVKKYISFMLNSIRFIRKKDFDIIHLHYFFPLAIIPWMFKKKNSKKLILTVHGTDLYEKMNNRLSITIFRKILKSYDCIICVGKELQEDFEKKLGIRCQRVLSAGVDKTIFYSLNIEKTFDFIFVGSLINRKGFDIVLQLINRNFANAKVKYKWCIVGSGTYSNEILNLANENPNYCTYYTSLTQPELNELYNKSRWFFFPSRNEPFGLVASEAIFGGTPVICSSSGGLSEQVIDGENGIILKDLKDANYIETVMLNAFNMEEREYSKYRQNCLSGNYIFSLQYVCDELIKVYETV